MLVDLMYAMAVFMVGAFGAMVAGTLAPVLGFAGMPGYLVHQKGVQATSRSIAVLGLSLCLVGQIFVSILFLVFVVESIRSAFAGVDYNIARNTAWFVGWMVAIGPSYAAVKDSETIDNPTVQHEVIAITGWVTMISYWVFVFWPSAVGYGFAWVPHF